MPKRKHHASIADTSPKRQRLGNSETERDHKTTLTDMPLEVLVHIILFLPIPRDLVSLSRTNSYLRHTLVNGDAAYIWRRLRESFNVSPLKPGAGRQVFDPAVRKFPDPTDMMKEWDMMYILFSEGLCEMCGEGVNTGFASYALKARICPKGECRHRFFIEQCAEVYLRISMQAGPLASTIAGLSPRQAAARVVTETVVPVLEPNSVLRGSSLSYRHGRFCRKSDLGVAVAEYMRVHPSGLLANGTAVSKYSDDKNQFTKRQTFFDELCMWKNCFELAVEKIGKENIEFAQNIARKEGWDAWDLLSTPTFVNFKRQSNRSMQYIDPAQYTLIEQQILQDLRQLHLNRQRRREEAIRDLRRKEIGEEYQRLVSERSIMPPLHTFRLLPVIYLLQNMPSSSDLKSVHQLLSSPQLSHMLKDQLEEWHQKARNGLAEVLGFNALDWAKGVRTATILSKPHPVDRLTALFECRRCNTYSKKYRSQGCLDFSGACRHECFGGNRKKQETWDPSLFVPCTRAIRALEEALALLGISPDANVKAEHISSLFLCGLCESNIVLSWAHIARHSFRHGDESLRLQVLSPERVTSIMESRPFFDENLLRNYLKFPAKHSGTEKKVFGCRHCRQSRIPSIADTETEMRDRMGFSHFSTSSQKGPLQKEQKKPNVKEQLFNFNALRSHIKAKHGADPPGTEDFFCVLPSP